MDFNNELMNNGSNDLGNGFDEAVDDLGSGFDEDVDDLGSGFDETASDSGSDFDGFDFGDDSNEVDKDVLRIRNNEVEEAPNTEDELQICDDDAVDEEFGFGDLFGDENKEASSENKDADDLGLDTVFGDNEQLSKESEHEESEQISEDFGDAVQNSSDNTELYDTTKENEDLDIDELIYGELPDINIDGFDELIDENDEAVVLAAVRGSHIAYICSGSASKLAEVEKMFKLVLGGELLRLPMVDNFEEIKNNSLLFEDTYRSYVTDDEDALNSNEV